MPIVVTCRCGQRFRAKDELAGKRLKCPSCGQPLTIPQPRPQSPASPDDPLDLGDLSGFEQSAALPSAPLASAGSDPLQTAKPAFVAGQSQEGKGLDRWVVIAMCVGGGVAALVILAIAIASFSGGPEDAQEDAGSVAKTVVAETPPDSAQAPTAKTPAAETPASEGDIPAWAGQRSDEPFDVEQYLISRAAPPDNAAPLYITGLAQIGPELKDVFPPDQRDRRVARARALAGAIGKLADADKLAAGEFPDAQVDQVLNDAASVVEQIDLAQSKPRCVFVTGFGIETLLPHVQPARELARMSILQMHQSRVKGDFSIAEGAIKRALRMSRDLQPRGFMVCQLVSIAMDGVILSGIDRLTLNDPQLTPDRCDRLLALLIEHQQRGLDRCEEGLRLEYISTRETIDDLQTGRTTVQKFAESLGSVAGNQPGQPRFERVNYEVEIAACNRLYALAFEEARAPYAQVRQSSRLKDEIEELATKAKAAQATVQQTGKIDVPMIVLLFAPPFQTFREAATRSAANLAGVQMLIALRRYELTHGQLPESLDAAAAETALKSVPTDPFSGRPMCYAIVSGKPTVYSTGKDLQDDRGRADWKHGTQPGDYLFPLTPRPGTRINPP